MGSDLGGALGSLVSDQRATNEQLVRRYMTWQRDVRNRQPSSLHDYASRLGRFLIAVGDRPLDGVTTEFLEKWVNRPRRPRSGRTGMAAPSTRAKDVSVLKSLYSYLLARKLIASDPTTLLVAPQFHNEAPNPIAETVWADVWNDSRLPDDARVVLGLGFFVGLRRHEITGLAPWNVDIDHRKLVGFVRKGGGRDHATPYGEMVGVFAARLPHLVGPHGGADSFLVPLEKMVRDRADKKRLLPWADHEDAYRFNARKHGLARGDVDPELVNRRLKAWLGMVNQEPDLFTPHRLRHSCATYLLAAGVPLAIVSRLLNHTNIQTTMRYVRAGGDELAEWSRSQGFHQPFDATKEFPLHP